MLRHVLPLFVIVALVAVAFGVPLAYGRELRVENAADLEPDPRRIPSVFFVAKSENKNQVHYGVHVDESCVPVGNEPIFAYWRMLERRPDATEPLLPREVPAYGLAAQRVFSRDGRGGRIVLTLNALPSRAIVIDTMGSRGGGCTATAGILIHGVPAALGSVFVQLRWPFGVDFLLISGRAANGAVLREKVRN